MEIETKGDGQVRLGGLFKLVAVGYLLGAGAIFVPLFLLISVIAVAAGAPMMVNGQPVEGGGILLALLPVLMLPVILAIQAVMFGMLVTLGLWIYSKVRTIRVARGAVHLAD